MTPAARAGSAIDILEGLGKTDQAQDRYLKAWFRDHRFAGSKDRKAITEHLYAIQRHRAGFAHRMGGDSSRALVIASLLADGADIDALFVGGYGAAPLTDDERARIAAVPPEAPLWVRGEFPQFLTDELTRAFGPKLEEEMAAFQSRAPVDLRVNTLKAKRDDVLAALAEGGIAGEAMDDNAIRCAPGTALTAHALFASGAFEIQDLSAQRACDLAAAKPGMAVLELAAGAGGKSLALAAAMRNKGSITACDVRGAALAELETRAVRAGVTIIATHILGLPPAGPYDLIFVDAPCSGSGTWRRQPEVKWRLTPARLASLAETQARLLRQAGPLLAASGRLIYATCSILPCENGDIVDAFLAENPRFSRAQPDFHATPAASRTDGFYAAVLTCI